VIDGKTGYLVPEGNWREMAEKMRVLARDPQLRQRMGQAGRENIEKVGNLSVQIEKLKRVLEQACESKPPD
jgi:glycosyltransferase involved in cell wall biosynthesis